MKHVLLVGGGYVGLYASLTLLRKAKDKVSVTLVNPESYMVYQPFLPEAASGSIEPRHVVVPLRPTLRRARVITGWVTELDHAARRATIKPVEGPPYRLNYDVVVVAPGSISRVLPVPGLSENAIGFKTVAEAIHLRNHVLERMDVADATNDPEVRRRALSFVFVGGGYAGIEALAELEDMSRDAVKYFTTITRADMRWVLVEAAHTILPEIGKGLGEYALDRLRHRGIETYLRTRLESAEGGFMRLSNGVEFEADTLVWTAGVKANPAVRGFGLPLNEHGSIQADECLRVAGVADAWTAGDCAAVPDPITGGFYPPTAQHAMRQAKVLAENILATLDGRAAKPFVYRNLGALVSLGRYKGVARVLGLRLRGFPAWFLHRTYHLTRIPTLGRKARVVMDWTVALFFRRDVVQLGTLQHPREAFTTALGQDEARS